MQNKQVMRGVTTLLLALLALSAAAAQAGDFYVGGSAGGELDGRYKNAICPIDADNTYRVLAGWQFREGWALEGAYHDFGDAVCPPIADLGFESESKGVSLGVMYAPRFDQWSPFAKVGIFHAEVDATEVGIGGTIDVDDSQTGLALEAGVKYYFTDAFALRAGYEWYDSDPHSDGTVNLGLEVHF